MEEKIYGYWVYCKESNMFLTIIPVLHSNQIGVYEFLQQNEIVCQFTKNAGEDIVDFAIELENMIEKFRDTIRKVEHFRELLTDPAAWLRRFFILSGANKRRVKK